MCRRVAQDAVVLSVALWAAFGAQPVGAAGAGSTEPLFALSALLTMADTLPSLSRSVLVQEAERIWRREGVALTWATPRGNLRPTAALRVLVISRREALTGGAPSTWTVGELVPHDGHRALAIASIAGAERVVEASKNRVLLLDRPEFGQYQLGVVLGRAVAHEIGHYLLATRTHADRGLMRAAIDASEFADPGARTFTLDEVAGRWIRRQLQHAGDPPLPVSGFTYIGEPAWGFTPSGDASPGAPR